MSSRRICPRRNGNGLLLLRRQRRRRRRRRRLLWIAVPVVVLFFGVSNLDRCPYHSSLRFAAANAHVWDPTLGGNNRTSKSFFFHNNLDDHNNRDGGGIVGTSWSSSWITSSLWRPFRRKEISNARRMRQAASAIHSELEDRWKTAEQTLQSQYDRMEETMGNIKEGVEEFKDDLEATVQSHANRLEQNVQKRANRLERNFQRKMQWLQQTFYSDILGQRRGFDRWIRTIRNHLLFLLGGVANFSSGLTPGAARRAIVFQSGYHTWFALDVFGKAKRKRNYLEEGNAYLYDVFTDDPTSVLQKIRRNLNRLGKMIRHATTSFLFKDAVAFLVALHVYQNKIPPRYQPLLETALPIASITHAVFRSARKIVQILMTQDARQQQHETIIHYTMWFRKQRLQGDASSTNDDDQLDATTIRYRRRTRKCIFVTLTTFIVAAVVLSTLPGITLPMVAASTTGSTLMLDSISDEVVVNWFHMLRRLHPKGRSHVFREAARAIHETLQWEFLYPAQAALEELETSFQYTTTSGSIPLNDNLQERIQVAVNQSIDVKLAWMMAAYGVLLQVLWMNQGLLLSMMGSLRNILNEYDRETKSRKGLRTSR